MPLTFSIVAAIAEHGGIGINGALPWHIKADMKYFRELTTNHIVIMGRKTWESIGSKPLSNRLNVVVTSNTSALIDRHNDYTNVVFASSFDNALDLLTYVHVVDYTDKKVFVIGGESLYDVAIEKRSCEAIYLTKVRPVMDCDTFFPMKKLHSWFKMVESTDWQSEDEWEYKFTKYELYDAYA